jgi:hypothetical protein
MLGSPRRLRPLALLGFSTLALALACGGAPSSSNNSGGASSTPAPSSVSTKTDEVVSRAIDAQNRIRDLTATIQSDTTQGARSFTTEGKVEWTANPERFYARTTSSLTNRQSEVILDSATQATYIKSGTGWIKSPVGSGVSAQGSGIPTALKGDAFKGFKVVGPETVQGRPTWHLAGPMPYTGGSGTGTTVRQTTGTLDVWVGHSDYRMVKQTEDLKTTEGESFSMKATMIVDAINSGLNIDLPVSP